MLDEILNKITVFADEAHGDQMRKYTPERYIVHPVRVMESCRRYTDDVSILAAALLHDVLEDTPVDSETILQFLQTLMSDQQARRTVHLVEELTDVYIKSDYPHLNRRKRKELELVRISGTSADAQTIKYADITDNCREIVRYDPGFAGKFVSECRQILHQADKGHELLYKEAVETINSAIAQLRGR